MQEFEGVLTTCETFYVSVLGRGCVYSCMFRSHYGYLVDYTLNKMCLAK